MASLRTGSLEQLRPGCHVADSTGARLSFLSDMATTIPPRESLFPGLGAGHLRSSGAGNNAAKGGGELVLGAPR